MIDMEDNRFNKKTDWTRYYSKKKSWFSSHTQQFTLELLVGTLATYYGNSESIRILELGGGNSCFANAICNKASIATYDIIDSNELAINLFEAMELNASAHIGYLENLLVKSDRSAKYDFVFSVGLIEHFRGIDIETIIDRHFEFCRDGGLVFVTFPTPTKKYLFVRRCLEILGKWQFYDEVPLEFDEVKNIFERNGTILNYFINKKLPLTQMVVLSKNKWK